MGKVIEIKNRDIVPLKSRNINGGTQDLYRFDNNYGASVVCHDHSYGGSEGKYELAVIVFDEDEWRLTYDTPVTNDVIGNLSAVEVLHELKKIRALT